MPYLDGGLFVSILPDERDYDIPDDVMKLVLIRFVESEQQTLFNEVFQGPLLQRFTEEFGSKDIAGQIPQRYSAIVDAYSAELEYIESQVERTLRSYESSKSS